MWATQDSLSTTFGSSAGTNASTNTLNNSITANPPSSTDVWAFRTHAPSTASASTNFGASSLRFPWTRLAPEEEEREEEALPSYLSYLQPSLDANLSIPEDATRTNYGSMQQSAKAPVFTPVGQDSKISMSDLDLSHRREAHKAASAIESKSMEFAGAVQQFILDQLPSTYPTAAKPHYCQCEHRVSELEAQVQTLQSQLSTLLQNQQSPNYASGAASPTTNALGDRVSTLEGRQSAFQSQLAQISKVLGVPVGKHGKHSQIKTLTQTLREEIDTKITAATADLEDKCASSVFHDVKQFATSAIQEQLSNQRTESTSSRDSLPSDAVLGALAEEHNAAINQLSAYVHERLNRESRVRQELETRVKDKMSEQEEWLQQLEGECGSWQETSASVSAKIHALESRLSAEDKAQDSIKTVQAQVKQLYQRVAEWKETLTFVEHQSSTNAQSLQELTKRSDGVKQLVEKVVRETGSAEELLQQYVSTITHQVASITRQYVGIRIRDNNRLIDATLKARVPVYNETEDDKHLLVMPSDSPELPEEQVLDRLLQHS